MIIKKEKPYDIRERSFLFALDVVAVCRSIQHEEKEFVLSKQLLRSGTAIGALIREAHNGESPKDFIHKMAISQKECDESIYWIDLIISSNLSPQLSLHDLKDDAEQLLKIIRTIILNKKQNLTFHTSHFIFQISDLCLTFRFLCAYSLIKYRIFVSSNHLKSETR